MKQHPMQNIYIDKHNTARFQPNKIVEYLLTLSDMNELTGMYFPKVDREQFAQLIGYSVSGFSDLPYASEKIKVKSFKKVVKLIKKEEDIKKMLEKMEIDRKIKNKEC